MISWRTYASRRRTGTAAAIAVAGALASALAAASVVAPDRVAVAAGSDLVGSHWVGFGLNENPQPPDSGAWDMSAGGDFATLTQRLDFISPGVVRLDFNLPWFWSDDAGRDVYNWNSTEMQNAYDVLRYYASKGTTVVSGVFGGPGALVGDSDETQEAAYVSTRFADIQAELVAHLQQLGIGPTYYDGYNEPNVVTGETFTYDDWMLSTQRLEQAFATIGVDKSVTKVGAPDTAEAAIAGTDGDMGFQTATCSDPCSGSSSLVWELNAIASFTARFYVRTPGATDITFETSADGKEWKPLAITHTPLVQTVTNPKNTMYRTDFSPVSTIHGAQYLRVDVPDGDDPTGAATTRSLASMSINGHARQMVDPMDDLSRTDSALDTGDWSSGSWWLQSAERNPELSGAEIAHFYDQELYGTPFDYPERVLSTAVGQLHAARPGVPVILGETGMKAAKTKNPPPGSKGKDYGFALESEQAVRMADLGVQEARAGIDGAAAWCLDGYAYETYCGMWGRGTETDPAHNGSLRPWFYTWGLMARYLPAGSVMHAPPQPADVRVLAAQLPDGGWTFVLVNRDTAAAHTVSISEATGLLSLHKYVYENGADPATDADGFPVPVAQVTADFSGGHDLTLPADSVVVLTTES